MEKLINQIPTKKLIEVNKKTGAEVYAGLVLRYSVSLKKWVCGYGTSGTNLKYKSVAHDPVEALAEFIELLNKQ